MMKLRSKILAGMSLVAVAGTVAATGLTSASASSAAGAGRSGFEFFQLMKTVPDPAPGSIIATGLFTAGGVDHPGSKVDSVVFPDGTFKIAHSPGTGTPRFNPKTCLSVFVFNGTYRLGHGTGAYAGISGHGIYRLNILAVGARNSAGQCSNNLPPVAYQQIIRAQGPVRL
ncbi:MAG: hypothetical protein JO287_05790 [Pseudonocardiales bacterium]|nr:hypothetical protein [Pseudonocardiales bacterium]